MTYALLHANINIYAWQLLQHRCPLVLSTNTPTKHIWYPQWLHNTLSLFSVMKYVCKMYKIVDLTLCACACAKYRDHEARSLLLIHIEPYPFRILFRQSKAVARHSTRIMVFVVFSLVQKYIIYAGVCLCVSVCAPHTLPLSNCAAARTANDDEHRAVRQTNTLTYTRTVFIECT